MPTGRRGVWGVLPVMALVTVTVSGYTGAKFRANVHPTTLSHLDLVRAKAQSGRPADAIGYAESMLMRDNLRVGIDYGDTPEGQRSSAQQAVEQAVAAWERGLDGEVKFQIVPMDEANIKIHFGSDVRLKGEIVSGYINWSRSILRTPQGIKPLFKADIHLRTTDPKGNRMNLDCMRHTCGHEFGHMFGLDDANIVGPIMGPLDLRKPVKKPSEAEVDTVRSIRAEFESMITEARGTHACRFAEDGKCSCGCCAH